MSNGRSPDGSGGSVAPATRSDSGSRFSSDILLSHFGMTLDDFEPTYSNQLAALFKELPKWRQVAPFTPPAPT